MKEISEILEQIVERALTKALRNLPSSNEPKEDKILIVPQAAAVVNLKRQTIYGKTSRNEMPYFKSGKQLFFFESKLRLWLISGMPKDGNEIDGEIYYHKKKKGGKHE